MNSSRELSQMVRNACASVALSIALGAGCSLKGPATYDAGTCNLPSPVTVTTDASTDGLPPDGNYSGNFGSPDPCAAFCDPYQFGSCQRISDGQVRCSNDRTGCI